MYNVPTPTGWTRYGCDNTDNCYVHSTRRKNLVIWAKVSILFITFLEGAFLLYFASKYYRRLDDLASTFTSRCIYFYTPEFATMYGNFCLYSKMKQTIASIGVCVGFAHVSSSLSTVWLTLLFEVWGQDETDFEQQFWNHQVSAEYFRIWFRYKVLAEFASTLFLLALMATKEECGIGEYTGNKLDSLISAEVNFIIVSEVIIIILVILLSSAAVTSVICLVSKKRQRNHFIPDKYAHLWEAYLVKE